MSLVFPSSIIGPRPSYANGFARSPGESENPGFWDGLVGLWVPALGPTGLTLFDQAFSKNHGALTNMDPATAWVVTEMGWGSGFDGNNDSISVPFKSTLNTSSFSVCALVKATGGQGDYRAPVGNRNSSRGYNFYAGNNDIWQFWYGDGAGYSNISGDAVVLDQWKFLVGTYDGTTIRFYNDGKLRSSDVFTFLPNLVSDFEIGRVPAGFVFSGVISSVGVFSRALLSSEIQDQYDRPFAGLRLRRKVYPAAVAAVAPADGVARMIFLTGAV